MKWLTKRFLLPLGFFIFILCILFFVDTANFNIGAKIVKMIPYGDKVLHTLLYGIMAMLLNFGLGYKKRWGMQVGAMSVMLFATIEEFSQMFIPVRTFDVGDLMADLFGVVLFSLVVFSTNGVKFFWGKEKC
jgi:VanZ family protein